MGLAAWLSAFAPAHADGPVRVENLSYDRVRHSLVLEISGPVTITTRSLKAPTRLVVDIPLASLKSRNRELVIEDGLVRRVRVSQFKLVPPTVRVVIETAGANEPLIAVQQTPKKLYITLAPAREMEPDASPPPGSPIPGAVPGQLPHTFTPPPTQRPVFVPTARPSFLPTPVPRPSYLPTPVPTPRLTPAPRPTATPIPRYATPRPSPLTRIRLRPNQPPPITVSPAPSPVATPYGSPTFYPLPNGQPTFYPMPGTRASVFSLPSPEVPWGSTPPVWPSLRPSVAPRVSPSPVPSDPAMETFPDMP